MVAELLFVENLILMPYAACLVHCSAQLSANGDGGGAYAHEFCLEQATSPRTYVYSVNSVISSGFFGCRVRERIIYFDDSRFDQTFTRENMTAR